MGIRMYCYYYIKTDCLTNTWDTAKIRQFLNTLGIFTEKYAGHFSRQSPFITLSLMKVKDINSWSGEDYDEKETNYIAIVTGESEEGASVREGLFRKLELFLGFRVCADDS